MAKHPPFCFLHIPKTGGITLAYIIFNQYRYAKTFTIGSALLTESFLRLPLKERAEYEIVRGHFAFDERFKISDDTRFFTMLREPAKRIISHYNFLFYQTSHFFHGEMVRNNYSLKDMLTQGHMKGFDNCMVRYLSGTVLKEFGKVDEADLKAAIRNFDKYFSSFGINEFFDESLLMLSYELNWKFPYSANLNETKQKKITQVTDEETKRALDQCTRFDYQLYNYALAKFKEKKSFYQNQLNDDLIRLREGNRKRNFFLKVDYVLNRNKISF